VNEIPKEPDISRTDIGQSVLAALRVFLDEVGLEHKTVGEGSRLVVIPKLDPPFVSVTLTRSSGLDDPVIRMVIPVLVDVPTEDDQHWHAVRIAMEHLERRPFARVVVLEDADGQAVIALEHSLFSGGLSAVPFQSVLAAFIAAAHGLDDLLIEALGCGAKPQIALAPDDPA
jgi:hypothetical protein